MLTVVYQTQGSRDITPCPKLTPLSFQLSLRAEKVIERTVRHIILPILFSALSTPVAGHSGGLNKLGCHAGSQPYHCHRSPKLVPERSPGRHVLSGTITHVRDGDTIEVDGIAVRISALDCPENGTQEGNMATKIAKKFEGLPTQCELTGAKSYDRLVGYCSVRGSDFGSYMMQNSSCSVWEKYDVYNRY